MMGSFLIKLSIIIAIYAIVVYFLRVNDYFNGPMCESTARIDGKTIIVTGANTGIGKETARDLVSRGGKVIMACRNLERCDAAAADIRKCENVDSSKVYTMKLDLASLKSVKDFASAFKQNEQRLDILINNAGVMATEYSKTEDGFEIQIGVNHFGHFLLTNILLEKLKASAPSRIVIVSSSAHIFFDIKFEDLHFEKNPYGYFSTWRAYAQSKSANVLMAHQLAKELKGTGVTSYSLHPGSIATDIYRHASYLYLMSNIFPFGKDIVHGAQTTICCAVDEDLANVSGKYYKDVAEATPSAHAIVDEAAQKLWDLSIKAVGLEKVDSSTQT